MNDTKDYDVYGYLLRASQARHALASALDGALRVNKNDPKLEQEMHEALSRLTSVETALDEAIRLVDSDFRPVPKTKATAAAPRSPRPAKQATT